MGTKGLLGLNLTALNKVKRNKPMMVFLLPVIACVFLVGWVMYVTGQSSSGRSQNVKHARPVKDNVTISAIPFEEEILAH
jgi:hypothetical protein